MTDVLIVEDDEAISNLIYASLKDEGYNCVQAYDGEAGADYFEKVRFDLVLLDIMLPKIDGYELLEYIRPRKVPVIFITARGEVKDKIKGLRLGADDYISKPFQVGELLARVEAVLRRFGKTEDTLYFNDLVINIDSRQVKRRDENIDLTAKEFDLLVELVRNKNIALYRSRLYEKVWQEPFFGDTRTLDSHIRQLRKKLSMENYIKTVFRVGYRLEEKG